MTAASFAHRAVAAVKERHAKSLANASFGARAALERQGPDFVALPVAIVEALLAERAAAPELLATLRGLVDCAGITALPGYRPELDAAMRDARAAIAKAEGRA